VTKGIVTLTTVFGGPGAYTFSWVATKRGYKKSTGTVSMNVTGPTNAPCDMVAR
jgi:hypothetical protein